MRSKTADVMLACMNVILTYRGRSVTQADVAFLRKLIADNPTLNRRALSQEVCRTWGWRQPNGVLKDAICRSLMLQLHRGDTSSFHRRWHDTLTVGAGAGTLRRVDRLYAAACYAA